ncbi:MAG: hypothetical protein Q8Q76_06310 [Methylotenera sp.]|nr:hypothetical protein [Methylotenera sp.]
MQLIRFILVFLLLCLAVAPVNAAPQNLNGTWYVVNAYVAKEPFLVNPLVEKNLQVVDDINRTGGHYLYQADFNISESAPYVVDFKNTSTIAQFRHRIYNSQNQLLADVQGGIENKTLNPFFLRHGREVALDKGSYKLITEIISPQFPGNSRTLYRY